MKPFNLEEALAGKPVVTRDGRKVTQFVHFKLEDCLDPIYGIVDDNELLSWDEDGKYWPGTKVIDDKDLFMASEEIAIWINIWKNSQGIMFCTNWSREDKADKEIEEELNFIHLKKIRITL